MNTELHCHSDHCHAHEAPDGIMPAVIIAAILLAALPLIFRHQIARAMFRYRLRRAINHHARNCPTGRAFYAALDIARRDNEAWLRSQGRRR